MYSQELHYYLFAVSLDKCVGSCNTLDDLLSRVCVPNETEGLNLHVFDMITGSNESRTLTKHISCRWNEGKKCNLNQKWNIDKCWCECKNVQEHRVCEKGYFWNPAASSCKNGKYAGTIIDDSVVVCHKIEETKSNSTKAIPTKPVPTFTS